MKLKYLAILLFIFFTNCGKNQNSNSDIELVAMAMKNGKYGYINTEGEFIIEPKYKLARSFSNGLASVNIDGQRNDIISGVVGGSYVFIDLSDKIVFDNKTFRDPMYFYNGYAKVFIGNYNFGFIDKKGIMIDEGFKSLGDFKNGLAQAWITKTNSETGTTLNKVGFIDTKGNWKIEYESISSTNSVGNFSDGLAHLGKFNGFSDGYNCGYIDKKNRLVIDKKYKNCPEFKEGLAIVWSEKKLDKDTNRYQYDYQFIDKDGKVVIDASKYDKVHSFSNGLAKVGKDGKFGFIDKKGIEVIELEYEIVGDFNEGFATYQTEQGKTGFINKNGDKAFEKEFVGASKFKNGYAVFLNENNKLGFISIKGEVVIEPRFDRLGFFVNPDENNIDERINL